MPKRKKINIMSTQHIRRLINEETSINQHFLDEQRLTNLDNEGENPTTSNIALNSPFPFEYSNKQIFDAHVNDIEEISYSNKNIFDGHVNEVEEVSFYSSNNSSEENDCNDAFQITEHRGNEVVNINQQSQTTELKVRLAEWAVKRNISHSDLSALLQVLKMDSHYSDLPTDPRTLLHTPRYTEIKEMAPGSY